MERADVTVVGGGILGLAVARALVLREGLDVVLLEGEAALATHQTGRNSGVIHAGLYYKPGTLKAELCVRGRAALYEFCKRKGIPHRRCGKLVVAVDARELPALNELERRAHANGLPGVCRLDPEQIREHESHAQGVAALLVPQTGIVNFGEVAAALAEEVRSSGGRILTNARLTAVERGSPGLVVHHTRGSVRSRYLVNCAGLHSDRVARLCGLQPSIRIVPFRGEYRRLRPERAHLVKHLLYPVPDPALPFLGVHFTRMLDGSVEVGPNAVLAAARHGYRAREVDARDLLETVSWPGFWRMAASHWRAGSREQYRSWSAGAFVRAAQRLVPDLAPEDLEQQGRSGVRAQAVDRRGRLVDDFHLEEGEGALHVLNAPSPAATAALAIAGHLAQRSLDRVVVRSA